MPMFRMAGGIVRTTTAVDGRSYLGGGSRGSPSCCLLSLLHYLVAVILRGVALSNARFCPPVAGCRRPADTRRVAVTRTPERPESVCAMDARLRMRVVYVVCGERQSRWAAAASLCSLSLGPVYPSMPRTHNRLRCSLPRRPGGREERKEKMQSAFRPFGYNTGVIPLLAPPFPLGLEFRELLHPRLSPTRLNSWALVYCSQGDGQGGVNACTYRRAPTYPHTYPHPHIHVTPWFAAASKHAILPSEPLICPILSREHTNLPTDTLTPPYPPSTTTTTSSPHRPLRKC